MRFKKGDILIFIILFVSVIAWYGSKLLWNDTEKKILVVEVDGKEYQKINLDSVKEEHKLEINLPENRYLRISYGPDGVHVEDEDVICPNKVCVKTGFITEVGESIVCLPNKVMAYIKGSHKDSKVDEISY